MKENPSCYCDDSVASSSLLPVSFFDSQRNEKMLFSVETFKCLFDNLHELVLCTYPTLPLVLSQRGSPEEDGSFYFKEGTVLEWDSIEQFTIEWVEGEEFIVEKEGEEKKLFRLKDYKIKMNMKSVVLLVERRGSFEKRTKVIINPNEEMLREIKRKTEESKTREEKENIVKELLSYKEKTDE